MKNFQHGWFEATDTSCSVSGQLRPTGATVSDSMLLLPGGIGYVLCNDGFLYTKAATEPGGYTFSRIESGELSVVEEVS